MPTKTKLPVFTLAVLCVAAGAPALPSPKKIMLMNRLAPSQMVLAKATSTVCTRMDRTSSA